MEDKTNLQDKLLSLDSGPSFVRRGEIAIEDFEAALNARAAQVEEELETALNVREAQAGQDSVEAIWKNRLAQENRARAEAARKAQEEHERAEAARKAREEQEKAEAARLARKEWERAEAARKAREEQEKAEAARKAREEQEKAEAARKAREEQEKAEAVRKAREEQEKAEAARKAREEQEKAEAARKAREEQEKAEAARLAREERERAEAARKAREEQEKAEAARKAREEQEKAEAARKAREEQEKAEAAREEQERDPSQGMLQDDEDDDDAGEALPVKKRRGHPFLLGIVIIFFIAFLGAIFYTYRHYADFFRTHFYSGTSINGTDISYMTVEEAKQTIANTVSGYQLTILERDGVTELLNGGDIGLAYVDDLLVDRLILEQDAERWFLNFNDGANVDVNLSTTYDEQKATAAVLKLNCLSYGSIVEPENACLVSDGGLYTIKPEVMGNKLDEAKLLRLVLDALDAGRTTCSIVDEDCYIYPTVTADDETLNARMNDWNKYLSLELVYSFGDNREVINGETLRPYISDDGTTVSLSTDWIRNLVYQWGQKYDTFGLERAFTTHGGEVITIPAGGDYGWVIDKDKTIEDVETAVREAVSGTREPIYLYRAMGWENGDLTGTYAEVSLSEQKMWCYKDGVCILETDVVTGKAADPERMTAAGCFAIDAKKKEATLGTEDVQGYSEPVSFWLPFNEGQGLHDAPWRTEFGGSVYLENGSHGCVNVPADKMETVFNALDTGNAVVVYDLNAQAEEPAQ